MGQLHPESATPWDLGEVFVNEGAIGNFDTKHACTGEVCKPEALLLKIRSRRAS